MQMFVLIKMAPDTVEELTVAANGKSLDGETLRYKLGDPTSMRWSRRCCSRNGTAGR